MFVWIVNLCQDFEIQFLMADLCLLYLLAATNNCKTKHLAKILIHLAWCLQECVSASDVASPAFTKALNALFVSSVFLKYLIENTRSDNFEELHLSLGERDPVPNDFSEGYTFVSCLDSRFSLIILLHTLNCFIFMVF